MDEFDLDLIHKAYAVALDFDTPEDRAKALKISVERLQELQATWTPFANAIAAAGQRKALNGISEFIDPETRKSWELITGTDAPEKQAALIAFANGAEVTRQKIFMQACIETYFDVTRVCKILGIGKKTLDNWKKSPEFLEMLQSIQFAKAQFAESMLFKLVAQGSEKAVLEANKALNRSTYGDKLEVSGQINHAHAVISLDALDLPLETRLTILQAAKVAGMIDQDGLMVDDRAIDAK